MKRKPLFKPKDPFQDQIDAMKKIVASRIKRDQEPVIDYQKAKEAVHVAQEIQHS